MVVSILIRNSKGIKEFDNAGVAETVQNAVQKFQNSVTNDRGVWAGMGVKSAKAIYSLVRTTEPSVVIETGVCNGVSSLIILLAIEKNRAGNLYSIDCPMYANESLPEFREKAYREGHAFSAIPSHKEPEWIIPDDLRNRWELRLGKSQRQLPKLITKFDEIDIFIHDSEHTYPCMMFKYELSWEWLKNGGILLSDDISRNESFDTFTDVRKPKSHWRMTNETGYAIK
jgi:predicted O-methyltransferase YrrM